MSYNNGYSKKQRQQLQQQQSNYGSNGYQQQQPQYIYITEPPNYQVPPQNSSAPRYRPRKEKFHQSAPYQYEPRPRYPYAQQRPQYYQQQHTVVPPPPPQVYVYPPQPQQETENSNDVADTPPVDIQAIEKVISNEFFNRIFSKAGKGKWTVNENELKKLFNQITVTKDEATQTEEVINNDAATNEAVIQTPE